MKGLRVWICLFVMSALVATSPLLSRALTAGSVGLCTPAVPATACPTDLRIATFNIHHGRGQDNVVNLARIADLASSLEVDVMFLNEVDYNWPRSGGEAQALRIGHLAGMEHVRFAPALHLFPWLGSRSPAYGNAVVSRIPWQSVEHISLPRHGTNEPRNLLVTRLQSGSDYEAITLVGTHLSTHRAERQAQLEFILELLPLDEPILLLGDFNSQPYKEDMQQLFAAGWIDVWAMLGDGDGFTFPSDNPRHRIDYVLAAPKVAQAIRHIEIVDTLASDHLPVIVDIDVSRL